MKSTIIKSTFIFLTLTSCHKSRTPDHHTQETPKALEDKNSSSFGIISKRENTDLVESLYNELLDKNPDLKELENKIENLSESQRDTTQLFDNYNSKNNSYYRAAGNHMSQIEDSVLRERMKNLIANSSTKYNASIVRHNELLKSIDGKNVTISDLHSVLKITRTLPLIEKYQKENLPSTKPLEGFIRRQEEVIKTADNLTKK